MSRRPRKQAPPPGPNDAPPPRSDRRWIWAVCLALAALTWLVFGQTRHHEFVNYDDGDYVYKNPPVSRGLTVDGIAWAFTHVHASNWHPLTWISHMADCQLYGLDAGGHHVTSVLIHGATAILLFLLLRQVTGFLWRSAFVAAIFAIHPLRVESVAWVAERKDVLCGLFFVLTLWAYVAYARRPFSLARYGLVALMLTLGLLSKPMLVTLPLVLLLADHWPLGLLFKNGRFDRRRILDKIPLLGLAAASCAATLFAQRGALQDLEQVPFLARVGNAAIAGATYVGQMFWPVNLVPLYPIGPEKIILPAIAVSLFVLLGISAGVFALRRRAPYLVTGWLWYLIMLGPVIGIVQVGGQSHADRYTYLPQIGLYLMLAWGVGDLCRGWRRSRVFLGGLSAAALLTLAFLAHHQTSFWRNYETLWTHTLACIPDNPVAQNNFGTRLFEEGKLDEAETHIRRAIETHPNWWFPYSNLGGILLFKSKLDEAIASLRRSLELNPADAHTRCQLAVALNKKGQRDEAWEHFQEVLKTEPDQVRALNGIGSILGYKNQLNEAIGYFRKALAIDPTYPETRYNLGRALCLTNQPDEAIGYLRNILGVKDTAEARYFLGMAFSQKEQTEEAIENYRKSLELFPDHVPARYSLALALAQQGRVGEAIGHYRKVLALEPDHLAAANNLAWLLATTPQAALRDGATALKLATRANQLAGGKDPVILDTLAAAYAETGQFPRAVETVRLARELARAQSNAALVRSLEKKRAVYETGAAFREGPGSD